MTIGIPVHTMYIVVQQTVIVLLVVQSISGIPVKTGIQYTGIWILVLYDQVVHAMLASK